MNVNDFYYLMQALVENQREYSRNLEFSLSMSMSMGYFALKSLSHSYSYNYSYSYGPQKRQLRNRHRKNDSVEIDDGRRREMVRTSSKPKYYVVRRFVLIFCAQEKIIADIIDPQFWEQTLSLTLTLSDDRDYESVDTLPMFLFNGESQRERTNVTAEAKFYYFLEGLRSD